MSIQTLSPSGRTIVQGMTSPSLILQVQDVLVPDPTSAVARLDVIEAKTWDRVVDGQLGALSDVESQLTEYGQLYSFQLRYNWIVGDLNLAGIYDAQFKVTFDTAEVQMFPQIPIRLRLSPRDVSGTPLAPSTTVFQEVRVDELNTFELGDIIYNDGSSWLLADTSDYGTLGTNVVTQTDPSFFYYAGPGCVIVFSADQGWVKGGSIFLDPANNGKPTQVVPTTAAFPGQWGHSMGGADSDRSWSFQNYAPWRL